MPHAALWVVQPAQSKYVVWENQRFNAARGFVGGAAPIEGATADSQNRFNAARGFVGGAALYHESYKSFRQSFNAARGFVGGAASSSPKRILRGWVSMPHAALWVVQHGKTDALKKGT